MNNQEKYNIVILFGINERNIDGKFEDIDKNVYLGGQIRMDAAVDFSDKVDAYILVGGSKKKVNDMKDCLEESFEKLQLKTIPKLIRIESKSNSLGNLWAVKKAFKEVKGKDFLKNKTIGLMTNLYHIPRVCRFASHVFDGMNINFIPFISEAILSQHKPNYMNYPKEFSDSLSSEIKGLKEWEKGIYTDQFRDEEFWPFKCYDNDVLESLN